MATRQVVKGTSSKIYDIIGNFDKGINTTVADDVVIDYAFRSLKNFYNEKEGTLSKRPGVYDTQLGNIFRAIVDGNYNKEKLNVWFENTMEGKEDIGEPAFNKMVKMAFKGEPFISEEYIATSGSSENEHVTYRFTPRNLLNYYVVKDVNTSQYLLKADQLLNGGMTEVPTNSLNFMEFILIVGGFLEKTDLGEAVTDYDWELVSYGISIYHVRLTLSHSYDDVNSLSIAIETKDPTIKPYEKEGKFYPRWLYAHEELDSKYPGDVIGPDYRPSEFLELEKYNGYLYAATGTNYILKIQEAFSDKLMFLEDTITEIGGYRDSNVYKPTPIEVSYIGFNILANDPISYIDNTGVTNVVKGVFFSTTIRDDNNIDVNEPIKDVPYNSPFNIHIMHSGDQQPSSFQYRSDNGDTDITTNPYKDFKGTYNADTSIFKCDGLNEEGNFEIKISIGENSFINYFSTGSDYKKETGLVSEINDLIFSSTKCKIIGSQLVLFGGHGYAFFSDFDRFDYFPNYYNVYVANSSNEEITAITYFRQFYAIFTNRQIKRMSGSFGTDSFGIYPLNDFMGCNNGNTIRLVNNNLYFVGNDGLYQLKQGYLGEGTENVEKIDIAMPGVLNSRTVRNAFVLGDYYIMSMQDGITWYLVNIQTGAFYEFDLSAEIESPYINTDNSRPFSAIFLSRLYDQYGNYLNLAKYDDMRELEAMETRGKMDIMQFRFSDLLFLEEDSRHQDDIPFISSFETPYINLGTPTHTKKFKSVFLKCINNTGHLIPLYITIYVDDTKIISPENYKIMYNVETATYYYVYKTESNASLYKNMGVLGELTLGQDNMGHKTVQQLKINPNFKGRAIKIVLSDGFDEQVDVESDDHITRPETIRHRNNKNFTLSVIGFIYKLKKVKEG